MRKFDHESTRMAPPAHRSHWTTTLSTVVGMTLTLTLVGVLAALLYLGQTAEQNLRRDARVQVYFQRELDATTLRLAQESLRTDEAVEEARYLDPAEASAELEAELGESFVDFLGYVPLPDVMDLRIRPEFGNVGDLEAAVDRFGAIPGVADVVWQSDLLAGIDATLDRILWPLAALCVLFLLVAVALINNTIRLTVFARRFIIKTMQLVGAKPRLIRRPFLIQGGGLGFLSGTFSFALVTALFAALKPLGGEWMSALTLLHLGAGGLGLAALGTAIGWASTLVAVNRYLALPENRLY
jgi:cell division transport system permease protein